MSRKPATPLELLDAPHRRRIEKEIETGLPPGTEVFSADNHISLAEDIWYERFPTRLKDRAPRVWQQGGIFHVGINGQSFLPELVVDVLKHFENMAGSSTANIEARMRDLDADGIDKELVFMNAVLTLFYNSDLEAREIAFRIYNEYMAELQAQAPGRFYGVGLINWWDKEGARRTLDELKSLGLKTYLMPLNPGNGPDGEPIDYASSRMTPIWDEIERADIPLSHHIGEGAGPQSQYNKLPLGFFKNVAPFREVFGKYIFGGILDRHPGLQIGWFEGGISWLPTTLQDAEHTYASYAHLFDLKIKHEPAYYWNKHMCSSFIIDRLGLLLLDEIGPEKVMWSADYPHNEGSFGYSRRSVKQVVDSAGAEHARAILSENVKRFLRLGK